MIQPRLALALSRLDALEARLCLPCNLAARRPPVRGYFALASRLGDGIAWYTMLVLLALLGGQPALLASLHMGLTALAGVLVYRVLKDHLVRERPFVGCHGVEALTLPLDRYSFPSGHTLHAVMFTVMLNHYVPVLLWVVIPFALSIALSRIVLGLHYPSDVLAGGLIGWALARASLLLPLAG
ncbi:MAG: phosphatase PAP2 family protein [Chromatiales bacterium]|nr:phosphatase PAP2 family protein [Chromatiales bacterium]